VIPADARGSGLIMNGIPAYLGLSILAEKSGEESVRDYRLILSERYLRTSSTEDGTEQPLTEWDDQKYLEAKAPVALYSVEKEIGKAPLLNALRDYLRNARNHHGSLPGSVDLLRSILAVTPEEKGPTVKEDLASVTVYDFSLTKPIMARQVEMEAHKFAPQGRNNRAEVAVVKSVTVAGRSAGKISESNYVVKQEKTPVAVPSGISEMEVDPDLKLIDRNRRNNQIQIR
jgi:hypothetical protein